MKKKCKIRILKEDSSAGYSETETYLTNDGMEETSPSVTELPTQNGFVSESNSKLYGESWYYMKPDSDSQSDHQWEKEDLDLAYGIIENEKKMNFCMVITLIWIPVFDALIQVLI